jgi:hypothetical protein
MKRTDGSDEVDGGRASSSRYGGFYSSKTSLFDSLQSTCLFDGRLFIRLCILSKEGHETQWLEMGYNIGQSAAIRWLPESYPCIGMVMKAVKQRMAQNCAVRPGSILCDTVPNICAAL